MDVLSGVHSTLGILFILSLELSLNNVCIGLLEVYEKGKTMRMIDVMRSGVIMMRNRKKRLGNNVQRPQDVKFVGLDSVEQFEFG